MLVKLLLALASGALIGIERERLERSAGLRTHMLVCAGSALFTLCSIHMSDGAETTRIAAQIVTGIGFLGAGAIFRAGETVRGLTTAAGIWVVAGIGMGIAAGKQLEEIALVAALLVFGVNRWLRLAEDRWLRVKRILVLTLARRYDLLAPLLAGLEQQGVSVEALEWLTGTASDGLAVLHLRVHLPQSVTRTSLDAWLAAQPDIRRAEWQ